MAKAKKTLLSILLGFVMVLSLCFGVVLAMPTATAKAETLATTNWSLAREGDGMFRIQNGSTYWDTYTNSVTTESMLDYTEINGKTLSEINAETPGAITVTLQPAGGTIGSFYRVNINTEIAGFTVNDIGTVVVRAGWSHTDANGTYTIDTDLYFAHGQNKWPSDNNNWKYIPATNVVDISDDIKLGDQGIQAEGTRSILISTSNNNYWATDPITPNEGNGTFLNMLYINGTSIKEWNNKAHAALNAGEITDISYGSGFWLIDNGPMYAPIAMSNSGYIDGLGSISQVWIPTGYISNVSSFKVAKGFANLQGDTLYYVSKDVEYVKSGSEFLKIASSVDISDAFKILAQDYTSSNGTMLYYLHTNNVQYWTQQYGSTGAFAINEKEWKNVSDSNAQGGAVQMSYIEFNGVPVYDINAGDNGAYGATQGNIASGGKYAPILAYLTPQEVGNAIKLQVPSAYPSGSGAASANHKTIAIKKGFYVVDTSTNIKYEVTRDIQWDFEDGEWGEHVEKIETTVTDARLFGDAGDAFAGIQLAGNDYNKAPNTYAGKVQEAKTFARSANFLSHILIDDQPLARPGEAFLNVWGNYGYFTFRPGNNNATKITILAGCQFPTYNALEKGAKEVYVTTQDITFVKDGDNWVVDEGVIDAGEYETSISSVVYARNNADNWMMFTLTEKDYPNAGTTYNVATDEAEISALNLYDKIIVDGYTLRSRIEKYGTIEVPKINLWQADCFGIRIAGAAGTLDGAQRVTIRAGAQFPSYAYITEGVAAYFVTTEEITFVNVGAENGVWERQYKATFVADGEVVETINYLMSKGFTAPEVPEKDGYRGKWESYTANGNITVNAVYTKNPTVLGTTGIKELRNIDGGNAVFVINPTNSDYPANQEGTWNLGLDVSHLQKFNLLDYITINGKTLREIGVSEMSINKWTRPGLGLVTTLSDSMTIEIKKGCEIPSYAFWQNPNGETSCYTVDADYTAVYAAGGETAFTITSAGGDKIPADFEDHYILSDLYKEGYGKTSVFQDGMETLVRTDGSEKDYRYGRVDSKSFTLSFDFTYSEANYYETFTITLGTEGYNSVKACFGWRIFLLRGNDTAGISNSQCIQFFSACDKGGDTYGNFDAPSVNGMYFVAGQTYHVTIGYKLIDADTVLTYASIDGNDLGMFQYDLVNKTEQHGAFSSYSSKMNTIAFCKEHNGGSVTICDPGMDMTTAKNTLILNDGSSKPQEIVADSYVLPALKAADYNMGGNVFVGWTSDKANLSDLYPAGYEYDLTNGGATLYPVWIGFAMQNGAAVRKASPSGIRFLVDVDKDAYNVGVNKGIITEIGAILCPTSYLTTRELTHELGNGYFVENIAKNWNDNNTYSMAYVKLSAEQYARSFSARGYMKINYTSGEGYIYTAYDANENARSMYQVANAAKKAGENIATDVDYINSVADVVVNAALTVSKNANAEGTYTVTSTTNGNTVTVTLNKAVKSVLLNGTRLVMGYEAKIAVDGAYYTLSDYSLSSTGLTFSFTLEKAAGSDDMMKKYHLSVIESYLNSDAYTVQHAEYIKEYVAQQNICSLIENNSVEDYIQTYNETVAELENIKTAAELKANNTSRVSLDTPVLSKGLGYTVTWTEVAGADYYIVHDDNDYRETVVVMNGDKKVYKAEVVGNHNITVTAHSYYEAYNSATSNEVATPEVKPVFSYKSMQDGLYKFSSSQMSTMGISTAGCYYDSSDKKYFVYYNKETGWSPNEVDATDWTSPAEFPAHAQRLKDMGNNIILVARDTKAEYKANDTWAASRLRYVMDTAWSMGMKVLVCDEIFYKYSMSDNSGTGATSKSQVTTAINNREGFADYVTHPAFYGFSLDDEPYGKYISAMSYTISALDDACEALGVENPFYLACLFQAQGGEIGTEWYSTQSSLKSYYDKWLAIDGVDGEYLYVDIYTQHAMDQPTNRYNTSFEVVYDDSYLGGKYKFYQAITAHTQNDGVLLEQDLYMSLLYAAAHNVAGYSWFCYFPIAGELAGTLGGYDGNGYGNGIGNNVEKGKCFYNAAKTAAYQYELIQGLLDGYVWKTRNHNDSKNLLTTTLSNGTKTATMYVNADVDDMSGSVTVTASGSECYLVGYGVGTADAPYQAVSGSVTLAPGQAVICIS